jgi:hypothetical protein
MNRLLQAVGDHAGHVVTPLTGPRPFNYEAVLLFNGGSAAPAQPPLHRSWAAERQCEAWSVISLPSASSAIGHCPLFPRHLALVTPNFSPVLDGRLVEKSRDFGNFASHQCQRKPLRGFGLQRKSNQHRMILWFCVVREGDIPNCSGKMHDPGKPAFRRPGILPHQLRTSPLFVPI